MRPPSASWFSSTSNWSPRTSTLSPPASVKYGEQFGVGLADHHDAARLDDTGLLGGDVSLGRSGELVVVHADVGDDGDLRVGDVGRIPSAEHADLDHGDIDGEIGEPSERRGSRGLEVRRAHPGEHLQIGNRGDLFGELLVADVLAVAAHSLVDPLEVRAGVRADA